MHVCECPHQCDTLGNISGSIESLRRSNVLVMMFAFPLVPWPFIGIAFYYHYERAWPGDMERDALQPLL